MRDIMEILLRLQFRLDTIVFCRKFGCCYSMLSNNWFNCA